MRRKEENIEDEIRNDNNNNIKNNKYFGKKCKQVNKSLHLTVIPRCDVKVLCMIKSPAHIQTLHQSHIKLAFHKQQLHNTNSSHKVNKVQLAVYLRSLDVVLMRFGKY